MLEILSAEMDAWISARGGAWMGARVSARVDAWTPLDP
jgi:hypothetical protein